MEEKQLAANKVLRVVSPKNPFKQKKQQISSLQKKSVEYVQPRALPWSLPFAYSSTAYPPTPVRSLE